MTKLEETAEGFFKVTNKKLFKKDSEFLNSTVKKAFDFAFSMTFANQGEHRASRSGGTKVRKNGEKFVDTFQGKLAEYAVREQMKLKGINLEEPDLDIYGLGEWDTHDFKYKNTSISIKSTKYYGDLLLLEKKDWNEEGEYLPNKKRDNTNYIYDYFVLVRIKPSIDSLMKKERYLYKDRISENNQLSETDILIEENRLLKKLFNIKENFKESNFEYQVVGCISNETLKYIIKNNYILPKGAHLNSSKTIMDAENFYIQAGNFKPLKQLADILLK